MPVVNCPLSTWRFKYTFVLSGPSRRGCSFFALLTSLQCSRSHQPSGALPLLSLPNLTCWATCHNPVRFLPVIILLDWTRCQRSEKYMAEFFFMLSYLLPLLPWQTVSWCVLLYIPPFTFEFAGIGRPERGGWAWGQASIRSKSKNGKK